MSISNITNAVFPLSEDQLLRVNTLANELSSPGLWWLSGYMASIATNKDSPQIAAHQQVTPGQRITVLYGSQTGNAKRVAENLYNALSAAQLETHLLRADAYDLRELKNERHLAIVISTQGDGDPPDDARSFVEYLLSNRAPKLPDLHYSVLGLGDSSYPKFCEIARLIDARLENLGATRAWSRADADLEIATVADPWTKQAIDYAKVALKNSKEKSNVVALYPAAKTVLHHRDSPFNAEVLLNQRITGRDSNKDVRHIELSLIGSGLQYSAGDAVGVHIKNPPALIDEILASVKLDGTLPVQRNDKQFDLHHWLSDELEITRLHRGLLAKLAEKTRNSELEALLTEEHREHLSKFLAEHQIADILQNYPAEWNAEEFVGALRPISPRLYSIASSPKFADEELHITLSHVNYQSANAQRWGAASNFLSRLAIGERAPIYIESNERFRLPQDSQRNIIMVGPGTGVAPFRAFVQERAAIGATGKNWLLFGNPHSRHDFLYQLEWQQALKRGHLHHLDLAFSRDQAEKIYVQHRLYERAAEVYAWLQEGAHLYVCGDAQKMAKDVHATLLSILQQQGKLSTEDASDYLNTLISQGRYARDVY